MVWFLAGGPDVLLHLSRAPDPGVRLPSLSSLTVPHCGSGGRPGVNSEENDAPYVPSGLQDDVYNCRH